MIFAFLFSWWFKTLVILNAIIGFVVFNYIWKETKR